MNSPTNLSSNLAVVLGFAHSTLCFLQSSFKKSLASYVSKFGGKVTLSLSSNPFIIGILLNGGLKSISNTLSDYGPSGLY
jgi:hypothetical protein